MEEHLSHALGIDATRNKKLEWHVEEVMNTGCSKADGLKKLASVDSTEDEKVYMGYLLAKLIIYRTTSKTLYDLICKLCSL